MNQATKKRGKCATYDIQLDRHEAKYIVPVSMLPGIREFIRPFCDADPHGGGDPSRYTVTTLQLDDARLSLHHAKANEAVSRFKLRVRTYGIPGSSPVFMEIKRKIHGTIVKSRTAIPFGEWGVHLMDEKRVDLSFKSPKEEVGFLEFRRLVHEIGARPVVLVRYVRESYFGKFDHYARVTMDSNLEYQPTRSWDSWGRGGRWIPMDSSLVQNKRANFSGIVLELKTLSDAPQWMIDLVMEFGLERTGNCKYSTAIWLESIFSGVTAAPSYAVDLLTY